MLTTSRRFGIALLLAVLPTAWVAAQGKPTVQVNPGSSFDLGRYRTFSFAEPQQVRDPALMEEILQRIEKRLKKKGWRKRVAGGELRIELNGLDTYSTMIGALRVDVYDVRAGEVAWQALASAVRSANRKEMLKTIDLAIKEMFENFPKAAP